jgi:hypothetical protein
MKKPKDPHGIIRLAILLATCAIMLFHMHRVLLVQW